MTQNPLTTKIFLDSGDPAETAQALEVLGFLDGQTTNPSLVAKNPEILKKAGRKAFLNESKLLDFYKNIVQDISVQIPNGSVSVEVYADKGTSVKEMLKQAENMYTWIPNAHIKFPTIKNGILAAQEFLALGGRVNMTLGFSSNQALAVALALKSNSKNSVFYSAFVGRQFDSGFNGIAFLAQAQDILKQTNPSIDLLAASFRNFEQVVESLRLQPEIITLSLGFIKELEAKKYSLELEKHTDYTNLQLPEKSKNLNNDQTWLDLNIENKLADAGLEKFTQDWKNLLS